jgi:tetratricopeptide (TPR) repeat protein
LKSNVALSVGGIMKMTNRKSRSFNRPERAARSVLAILFAGTMLLSTACMTTGVPSFEDSTSVSEARAKRDLGIDYLSSRRTAMAIRELRASVKLDASDPQTYLWLGESYRRKGRTEEAESYLLDAIRLSVAGEDAMTEQASRLTLSALLSQMGRFEESLEHCEALSEDPTFASPWRPLTNCGWALMQLGRIEEARAHFEDALDFFPRFGPALLNLGILETDDGHPLKAIKLLGRALDSGRLGGSALGETHFRLGEIYVALGRRDKAVEHFKEATSKAPYADWGTQSQAYLELLR